MQESVHIRYRFNEPIGVANLADLHLGAEGVRYDFIWDVIEAIVNTEGCYASLNGDMIDNLIWKRGGKDLVGSFIQKYMIKDLVSRLFMKTLWLINGCHDEWSWEYDSFDVGHFLADHCMGAYLGAGGDIKLDVAGAPYHIHARHKYTGNSRLNIENPFRRMYDGIGSFDVGVLGHTHSQPFIMHLTRGEGEHRRDVVYAQAGTAKIYDRWSQFKLGAFGAEFVVPFIIFMPERQNMIAFKHLGTGLGMLKLLRAQWSEQNE
jgi:hypothetical protein